MTEQVVRACLVSMPWHALSRPSIQIEVLRAACVADGLVQPAAYHGGLRFAEFLTDRTDGVVAPFEYTAVAEDGFHQALGDWVFAGVLNGPDFGDAEMRAYAAEQGLPLRTATAMRELAGEFVDQVVDELIALDVNLVGFSSTFMQNVPSLATAKRLKQRRPDIAVVFGGGNCDGDMGVALHREFPFVDFVLRGEADETFPRLLRALAVGDPAALANVGSLCWREESGAQRVNQLPPRLVPPVKMARPDFDDWFATFEASTTSSYVEPELVVESARGCWWGEHHHCTFCGLNGTSMAFRAKPPEVFVAEVEHLVRRHRVLDVTVVDNILEPRYLREALPSLGDRGWDLRMHYDIKANVTAEQIGVMRRAGVYSVQPGIESLVDDVLTRMDKGVRAERNIRTMRDCGSAGLTVAWNWLYGFPGERAEDYTGVLAQVPALVHLQPPGSVARIEMNRFSPYFNDLSLGFPVRTPAKPYEFVYDIPAARLHDLVYLFDTPPRGLSDEEAAPLHAACDAWSAAHAQSSLTAIEIDGGLVLRDRRVGWPQVDHVLTDPRELATWIELEHGRSVNGLVRRLADAGTLWPADQLDGWLHELRERGLVFVEQGRWIALATRDTAVPAVVHA